MPYLLPARPWRDLAITLATASVLAAHAAPPLSFDEALRMATTHSPQLAAQRASAQAARSLVGPASQLPDPKLLLGLENVPVTGTDRWSLNADGMTMKRIGVMQDFMRGEKLDARAAKAQADADREAAMVDVQELEVSREVATAWLERHFARKSRGLIEEQLREVELQVDASRADLAAGKAGSAEAIAARGLRATLLDRLDDVNRQERRATAILARWLGSDAEREPGTPPDVTRLSHDIRAIVADMEGHPELTQYAPMVAAAEAELKMAAASNKPDVSVELSYGQRGMGLPDMLTLMVRTDLPFFTSRRQDPVTESRRRQLDQVRGQVEEMSRKHVAEARAALQDWEAARARLARHRDEIIPLAVDRERAQLAAYQGGRGELAMVLEARRMVLEARMNAIAVETELARSWAQLAFLIPWSKP